MPFEFLDEIRSKLFNELDLQGSIGLVVTLAVVIAIAAFNVSSSSSLESKDSNDNGNLSVQSSDALPALVSVYVSGEVESPGVFELSSGSRVCDAIEAAGGITDKASIDTLNLARKVSDGEHVFVPSYEDPDSLSDSYTDAKKTTAKEGPLNINRATAHDFETLPGIGPATASKIVSYRESNGPFPSVDNLVDVPGIGSKKLDSIRDLICV